MSAHSSIGKRLRSSGSAALDRVVAGSRRDHDADQLGEIVDDDVGAGLGQPLRPDAAVDADDQAEAAGPAGLRRRRRRPRTTTARSTGTPSWSAACDERVRAPACRRRPFSAATLPSTTTSNRRRRPAASSTAGALRDDETTATLVPRSARWSSSCTDPGRVDALVAQDSALKNSFLRLPSPQTVSACGTVAGSPSGSVMPRDARNARTPS